ncbi:hypothetical protein CXQ85_004925 [Candidozyma haemuli]|uniref:Uncharacterized protein n=1 Tax=Candidozyma haemuli TaxID=45357 RepID=A0A2V1ATF1_9ASCO|nr:hypothetical protein CXQ85_004552 [[Candida] haemuloni]XP_025343297.1 hypothetical protein CXQ85_004925 [[Candida] haemuloni]PVH21034.1 hypothetical protein CXQ85_004552 [[Candida] haemuloni]PVH22357.1 hypothetical protein CXQ85_004925 [[Candida] haemuloni]
MINVLPLVSLIVGATAQQPEPINVDGNIGQHLGLGNIEAADVSSLWSGLDDEARKALEAVDIYPGKSPNELVEDVLLLAYGGNHHDIDFADKSSTIAEIFSALGGIYAEFASDILELNETLK